VAFLVSLEQSVVVKLLVNTHIRTILESELESVQGDDSRGLQSCLVRKWYVFSSHKKDDVFLCEVYDSHPSGR
jgi:hypothetical protein